MLRIFIGNKQLRMNRQREEIKTRSDQSLHRLEHKTSIQLSVEPVSVAYSCLYNDGVLYTVCASYSG